MSKETRPGCLPVWLRFIAVKDTPRAQTYAWKRIGDYYEKTISGPTGTAIIDVDLNCEQIVFPIGADDELLDLAKTELEQALPSLKTFLDPASGKNN
jgi:hypothetical protein